MLNQFLNQIIPDQDNQSTVFNYLANAYQKKNLDQKVLVLIGNGSNGKTIFRQIIAKVFGDRILYCDPSTLENFSNDPSLHHSHKDKLLMMNEFDNSIDTYLKIVSGDYHFHGLIVETNMIPDHQFDPGFLRRLSLIEFPNRLNISDQKYDLDSLANQLHDQIQSPL